MQAVLCRTIGNYQRSRIGHKRSAQMVEENRKRHQLSIFLEVLIMRCLRCKNDTTKVVDSRLGEGGFTRVRRHECKVCGYRFNTYEVPENRYEKLLDIEDEENLNNLYLIVGPSGSGKTTVVDYLVHKYPDYKDVKSYTTRPKRYPSEGGHIFISTERFLQLDRLCAYTLFDGYEYGVTADQLDRSNLYIIDPDGVQYLLRHYKNRPIRIIWLDISADLAEVRMIKRGDSKEKIESRISTDKKKGLYRNTSYRHNSVEADLTIRITEQTDIPKLAAIIHNYITLEELSEHETHKSK